jgi:hypothetical protein
MAASANLKELVDAMPSPKKRAERTTPPEKGKEPDRPGILSEADKPAMEKALAEIHAGGRDNVVALVGMLVPEDPPADSKVRHALHALATKVSGTKGEDRKAFAEALASTLGDEPPKEVRQFIIRQLQLCGGKEAAPALGKLLGDEALAADATTALLGVRDGAAEQFRAALPKSAGKTRVGIVQALGVLKDAESAAALREAVSSSQVGEAAAWALANIGDAGSADLLLKLADAAEGFDRTAATNACLLLAENLAAAGKKADARKIYSHLWERPSQVPEDHVKQAAQAGIQAAN